MAYPLIPPKSQWVDANGNPMVGGKLEFRDPSTDALKNTYPTADDADAQTNPNDNPVILDSRGEAAIFLEDGATYKVTMYDASDVQKWTVDDVAVASSPGASQVTITDSGGYYVASNVEAALQELGASTGAAIIGIADGGGYYSSTDVEGALQELGPLTAASTGDVIFGTVGTSTSTTSTTFGDVVWTIDGSSVSDIPVGIGHWMFEMHIINGCANGTPDLKMQLAQGTDATLATDIGEFTSVAYSPFSGSITDMDYVSVGTLPMGNFVVTQDAGNTDGYRLDVKGEIRVSTAGDLAIQYACVAAGVSTKMLNGGWFRLSRTKVTYP